MNQLIENEQQQQHKENDEDMVCINDYNHEDLNFDDEEEIEKRFKKCHINHIENQNYNDSNSNVNIYRDYYMFRDTIDDIKISLGKLNLQMDLMSTNIQKLINTPSSKHEKIYFDKNETIPNFKASKLINFDISYNIRAILCNNSDNFGKIVGKNGYKVKDIREMYNIIVAVPKPEDAKDFPCILIINRGGKNNCTNFDKITAHVTNIVSDNNNNSYYELSQFNKSYF